MRLFPRFVGIAVLLAVPTALAGTAAAAPVASRAALVPATHTVPVGSNPIQVAVSQRLDTAFVLNDGSVSEISLLNHQVVAEYSTGGGEGQNGIALVQSDSEAYITNRGRETVAVLDTRSRTVVKQIRVGYGAVNVIEAVVPGRDLAYVAFKNENKLTGINTATGTVAQTVRVPEQVEAMADAPQGVDVWAGSFESGKIFVVDSSKGTVRKTIDVSGLGPIAAIAFSVKNKQVWVAGITGVAVLNLDGSLVTFLPVQGLFPVPVNLAALAFTGSQDYVLVENAGSYDNPGRGEMIVMNAHTYAVVQRVPLGVTPQNFDVDTIRDTAYVPNYGDDTVTYFAIPQ